MTTLTVLDFDDTLAQTEAHIVPPLRRHLFEMMENISLSEQEFMEKTQALSNVHGSSIHGWAAVLGHPLEWVVETFSEVSNKTLAVCLENLKPDVEMNRKLVELKGKGHTLAILTHGHIHYIKPLLKHLEIDEIIPENHVFDISRSKGILKRSEESYRMVLNTLSDNVFLRHNMVEDTAANLVIPKKMGFTTWLVGHKPASPEQLASVDHHLPHIHAVLDTLLTD